MATGAKLKLVLLLIFVSGAVWATSLRFVLVDRPTTHYHADFVLYANNTRQELQEFTYYEELNSCSPEFANDPSSRVHLHDNIPTAVHVHDKAATWGHLFENLGFALGRDILRTNDGLYVDGEGGQLRFILNGREVAFVNDRVIESEDVLLVDFGTASGTELMSRYEQIPRLAAENNSKDDPAACAGSSSESFVDRLGRTLGLNE